MADKLFLPKPLPSTLLTAARALRASMTDAEHRVWSCLRRKQLGGFRFRRQHPFERFVLDFYCTELKLAVELDGGHHNDPVNQQQDRERTSFLDTHGIVVLRFWNSDVTDNLEGVLQKIYSVAQQKSDSPESEKSTQA